MKYSILINQVGIVRSGLHKVTDITDWMIIDYLKDWFFAENKKTMLNSEDGKQYTWVNYKHLIESMPLLGIKDKDAISKRFKKLKQLGLIKTITLKDNSLYFILTEQCINTCFYSEKLSNSIKTDSKSLEIIEKNDTSADLSDRNRTGYPIEIGQGVSDRDRTAQIEYQSNSISIKENNINSIIPFKRRESKAKESTVDDSTIKLTDGVVSADGLPDWVPKDEILAFVKMRKTIKKPLTVYGFKLAIGKLKRLYDEGEDIKEVLNQSILNSWQGLFPVKKSKEWL